MHAVSRNVGIALGLMTLMGIGGVLALTSDTLPIPAATAPLRPAPVQANSPASPPSDRRPLTLGEQQILQAESLVASTPEEARGYHLLTAAYLQRARESGDFQLNQKAEWALQQAAGRDAQSIQTLKLQAVLHLTFHRFAQALEVAQQVVARDPQDWEAYGALVDALVELGKYPEAILAAQQMVDLRPNTASYSRISYLRALHGDRPGAIEAMQLAVTSASPADPEGLAWCLVHLAIEQLYAGDRAGAQRSLDRALYVFPAYYPALATKGQVLAAAGDFTGAIALYEQAVKKVPLPDTTIALADLYARVNRRSDAERLYQQVEVMEQLNASPAQAVASPEQSLNLSEIAAGVGAKDQTWSRTLAQFWADQDRRLDEALAIAQHERSLRADIYTSDVLAWCLFKVGRLKEAKAEMRVALRLGTEDPRMLFHSGMIDAKLGNRAAAQEQLSRALEIHPAFDVLQAEIARATLRDLQR